MQARLATAILVTLTAATSHVHAGTRCEAGNLGLAEQAACAKAAESATALRQYLQRTRSMHTLHFHDFVKQEEAPAAATTARRSAPTAQRATPAVPVEAAAERSR